MGATRLRVVQWATGNIGTRALRAVLEHPRLDLVGVHVYTADKVGRDAGELCGLGATGVLATGQIDEVLALRADCVLYMPRRSEVDELGRILASGTNVVSTAGGLHHVPSIESTVRESLEAACAAGDSSIHCTGSSPGFISEAVPIVLTSIQRRLDSLTIDEFADLSRRPSPELLFGIMGFGRGAESFGEGRWAHGAAAFGPSLRLLGDSLGLPLDRIESSGEVAVARHAIDIAAGTVDRGTVAAQRMVVTGFRQESPLLCFRAVWYCTDDLEPRWDLRPTGWRVVVAGDAPLDVDLRFQVPLERMAELSPGFTAHRAVNAVPAVCEAASGIRTTVELPQVVATFA